ncbi:metal ABC transporter solute-binding protein, Zn/Mn family [Ferdinandcohnia quinoae]|uniref:Zinc ABC transporter substrate-binding protein n=1 Tax=Fredinandcohnia quinoae TaxID=2918902 RepID=A0AAW5E2V7_9BACI|nr:zinc ABC transporter substrate-binding protein [Fredinandcohnia sp. SECRCQ15]MCH1624217.1 zinc ABC transporter substrate-binding protein [Fredinandcohnia sp. SECRCQ15]
MKIKHLISLLVIVATTLLFGCAEEKSSNSNDGKNTETPSERLTIFTTVFPLQDFTEKIGSEHVEVLNVFPTGADAHSFEPTPKTMVEIAEADALIYIGAGVEGFVDAAIDTLQDEKVQLVKATEGMELAKAEEEHNHDNNTSESEHKHNHTGSNSVESHDHDDEQEHHEHEEDHDTQTGTDEHHHHHGGVDPHVWLDPQLAMELAEKVLHTLAELKPEAKDEFERNYEELVAELQLLDQEFESTVSQSSKKEILVSHAAYGYWESRYGIKQISVLGLSPSNEPTQKELTHIISTAKEHDIKFVMFDQNVTSKISEIVQKELNAEALTLHNLESITEEDAKSSADYFSIMRKNIETLNTALN